MFPAVPIFAGQTTVTSQNALIDSGILLIDDFWFSVINDNPAFASTQTFRVAVTALQNDTFTGKHTMPNKDSDFCWNNFIQPTVIASHKQNVFGGILSTDTSLTSTENNDDNSISAYSKITGSFIFAHDFSNQKHFGFRASFSGITDRICFNGIITPGMLLTIGNQQLSFWFPTSYSYTDGDNPHHNIDTAAFFADTIKITQRISFKIPAKIALKTYITNDDFFFSVPLAAGFSFIMQATDKLRFFIGSDISLSFDNFAYFNGTLRHKLPMDSYFKTELTPTLHAGLSAKVHDKMSIEAGLGTNWLHYIAFRYKRYYTYTEYIRSDDTLEIFTGISLSLGCSITLAKNLILHICTAANDLDSIYVSHYDNARIDYSTFSGHFTIGGEIEWRM